MKDILLFTRKNDPYCAQAKDWVRELLLQHPEYADIPLAEVDSQEHPEIAGKYDFYFVPTFFVGGTKICECALTKQRVAEVFAKAWTEPDTW